MDVERSPRKRQLKISDDFRITKRIVKKEKKETHQDEERENVRRPEAGTQPIMNKNSHYRLYIIIYRYIHTTLIIIVFYW